MFDCGIHMGYQDERRFPNFRAICGPQERLDDIIDLVVVSHLSVCFRSVDCLTLSSHLDHCGALPYFTEMCGYDGPVVMTVCESGRFRELPSHFVVPHESSCSNST